MKSREKDTHIAGSYRSVTGLFLCSHLCSEMPQSPATRVPATRNVFCLQYTEKPHLNAAWKPSLGYQLLHTLSTFFALWTCSGVVACFILKSFKWDVGGVGWRARTSLWKWKYFSSKLTEVLSMLELRWGNFTS